MSRTLLVAALAALVPSGVSADEYHHQGMPVGARAAGMAGAFTGLASDSSATWYNPAGLTLTHGTQFSLSTSVYAVTTDAVNGGAAPIAFSAYPSTFAFIKTPFWAGSDEAKPRHRYGISVLVTDYSKIERQAFDEVGSHHYKSTDETDYYGASYAYQVTPELSVGASAFLVTRDVVRFTASLSSAGPGEFDLYRRELTGSHYAAQVFVGALYRPGDRWSAGLTLRTPSLGLRGSLVLNEFAKAPGVELEERTSTQGLFISKLPPAVALGATFRAHERVLLSGDVAYYGPLAAYPAFQTEDLQEWVEQKGVLNAALGAEVTLTSKLMLRGGVYTDRSARARPSGAGDLGALSPDFLSATVGMGYETEQAAILLGGAFQLGRATTAEYQLDRQEVRWWVAGSYRL